MTLIRPQSLRKGTVNLDRVNNFGKYFILESQFEVIMEEDEYLEDDTII